MPDVFVPPAGFPLKRETCFLTRVNRLEGGAEYRLCEQQRRLCRWEFDLRNATLEQLQRLEASFQGVAGRYESFAFLDPLENLLLWSEDFSQTVWEKTDAPAFQAGGQLPDPLGGNGAQRWSNTSPSPNALSQWLAVPEAGLQLTGSVWAKAASPVELALAVVAEGQESFEARVTLGTEWRRYSAGGRFGDASSGQQVGLRLQLPPDSTVDLFGAQLMALPSPGAYTKTTDARGFHPRCRFGSDVLSRSETAAGSGGVKFAIVEFA
jgi:hypothetical protein